MKDQTKLKLIKALFAFLLLLLFLIIEAFSFAPYRLDIEYHTLTSTEIPTSFDNFSICYFSDIHYGTTYNEENIHLLTEKVNLLQPDIILFGGDLMDSITDSFPDSDYLTEALKDMKAKHGKFAVLGNHDYALRRRDVDITEVLTEAGFTIIQNSSMRVHNGSSDSIRLVGLDSSLLGYPNVNTAFSEVRASDFTLLLTHTPDNIELCNKSLVDLQLSGHSHGTQIYLPLISSLMLPSGSKTYYRGVYKLDEGGIVYVSNGVGTTKVNARLFANPEIVLYRLKHQEEVASK